jgi:hypothetical protein
MSYLILVGVWFVSFQPFPAFINGSKSLCLFIHKTIINMKMIILISLLLLFSVVSCNTTDPKLEPDLKLELKDVSCTEAWLQLTTNNIQLPATINLLKNNSVSQAFSLSTKDSLLYIDSLLPNQNYSFQVSIIQNPASSNKVTATTLDTTSHNFTWQTFEFGEITSQSHLFDVAIIDENDIWAVGEIYMNDSLGNPDPSSYNAVHWNGQSWEPKRIYYYGACSAVTYPPLTAIWSFDANNIVVTNGGSIGWFNGSTINLDCRVNPLLTGAINKIWGSSRNDLYVVGGAGSIANYNGNSWTKIESGTSLFLADIAVNNSGEIFICGGNPSFGQGIILKSSNGNNFSTFAVGANIPASQLFNPNLYGSFSSIWFDQNNTLYSGGNILFQNKFNSWSYVNSLPENFIGGNPGVHYRGYITKVRGVASNDMWIVGDRNTLRHFNGSSWEQIGMPYDPQVDLVWRGMQTNDDMTVVVGSHNRKAIIMMIKK